MQTVPRHTAVALLAAALFFARPVWAQFVQTNLVSDGAVAAAHTDPNLMNPWGIVNGPFGSFFIANNHSALGTAYFGDGSAFPTAAHPLAFNIPGVGGGAPDGEVVNETRGFLITKHVPAVLLFSGEDGTITGWSPFADPMNATILADNSASGAVYKGLAMGRNMHGNFLYATDFHNGKIDVYDNMFHLVGSFTDPGVDANYAPFGIENVGGLLFVTFALQLPPDNHDDEAGAGHGYVDVFTTGGVLVKQLVVHGVLNSPWGMQIAPKGFGKLGGALLVGDFGDGRINAFDPKTGAFIGTLQDANSVDIQIQGLWGLRVGGGDWSDHGRAKLFFTAGTNGENDGLFGSIAPVGKHGGGDGDGDGGGGHH